MRKLITWISVLAVILMQIQGVFSVTGAQTAIAQSEQVVLDNDTARVAVTSKVVDDTIEWTLDYTKRAPNDTTQRAIRFKLAQAANGTGTVQQKSGDLKQDGDDEWYREAEFTNQSEGKFIVTTPLDAKQLVVWTQVDEETMGQQSELLTDTDAEAKTVAAPEIAEDAAATETDAVKTDESEVIAEDDTIVDESTPEIDSNAETENSEQSVIAKAPELTDKLASFLVAVPHERVGSTGVNDPFTYLNHDNNVSGVMPKNNENTQLGGSTSDDIRNYKYSQAGLTEGTSSVTSLLNGTNAFDNGYHNYLGGTGVTQFQVSTKKTVQSLGDNEFKVQLDMIGDAIKPIPKADIVLVIDNSSSMNTTDSGSRQSRWQKLKDAVKTFTDTVMTTSNDFQVGLAAFGSSQSDGNNRPYGKIGSFADMSSTTQEKITGFTKSATAVQNHSLLSGTSAPTSSGTPTFLGVDAGLRLLSNQNYGARDKTQKILITVTDGLPTFGPTTAYYRTGTAVKAVETSLKQATANLTNSNRALRYMFPHSALDTYFTGDGTSDSTTNSVAQTNPMIQARYAMPVHTGLAAFSIGLYTGSDATSTLNTLGRNGSYNTDSLGSLTAALMDILEMFMGQIVNAQFYDPMSEYVTKTSTITLSALTLENRQLTVIPKDANNFPSYASSVNVDVDDDNQIKLSNVNLGGNITKRYGLRITYTVKLDDPWHDGTFYPTNGNTYLKNGASTTNEYLHFAVPSVKQNARTFDINVVKNWDDKSNQFGTRQDIQVQLERRTATTNWIKIGDPIILNAGNGYTGKFARNSEYVKGEIAQYRLVEVNRVPGYNNPTYSPATVTYANADKNTNTAKITITNKLKLADFEFTKRFSDGKVREGIEFRIKDTNFTAISNSTGVVKFTGLPVGEYTVEEVNPPVEFAGQSFALSVKDTDKDNELAVTSSLGAEKELMNDLKEIDLELIKIDSATQDVLKGAKFQLFNSENDAMLAEGSTGDDGLLLFKSVLKPGKYRLVEATAPPGFALLSGEFTFTVTADGKLQDFKYSGNENDFVANPELVFEQNNSRGKLTITAKNRAQAPPPLPVTGGTGLQIFLIVGALILGVAGWWKLNDWRKRRGGDGDA